MWRLGILSLILLTGCASTPRYIVCKGKAAVTGDAHISAGYGGANRVSLTGDCGEGFVYYHGDKPLPADPLPKVP